MLKSYLCFALLFLSLLNLNAQNLDKTKDWAVGISLPISSMDRAFDSHHFDASSRVYPYHFAYRYFGVSSTYKGISLNILLGGPDNNRTTTFSVDNRDKLPWVASLNAGYQYSTNRLKPSHKMNMIYGGYIGFDNLEFGVGLESKYVIIMLSYLHFNPSWKPKWYTDNFEPDMYFENLNSSYQRDPYVLQLKLQYKFQLAKS